MNTNTEANVILFIVDQLSAKWLEAARDEKICALPTLDWLCENGTTFTQTFTSNHPLQDDHLEVASLS